MEKKEFILIRKINLRLALISNLHRYPWISDFSLLPCVSFCGDVLFHAIRIGWLFWFVRINWYTRRYRRIMLDEK